MRQLDHEVEPAHGECLGYGESLAVKHVTFRCFARFPTQLFVRGLRACRGRLRHSGRQNNAGRSQRLPRLRNVYVVRAHEVLRDGQFF
jgi:hypothetical protein